MAIEAAVILEIARQLLAKWGNSGIQLPDDKKLKSALDSLIAFKEIVLPSGLSVGGINPTILNTVEVGIQTFKNVANLLTHTASDRVLSTSDVAKALSQCSDIGSQGAPPKSEFDNLAILEYVIDGSVRTTVEGIPATELIEAAAAQWSFATNSLRIRDVTTKTGFNNVTIVEKSLDLSQRVLGRAPLAGRGALRGPLVLEINKDVDFSADLFQATVCHELGHIAGLGHSSIATDLMAPVIVLPSVRDPAGGIQPSKNDFDEFKKLWPMRPA